MTSLRNHRRSRRSADHLHTSISYVPVDVKLKFFQAVHCNKKLVRRRNKDVGRCNTAYERNLVGDITRCLRGANGSVSDS